MEERVVLCGIVVYQQVMEVEECGEKGLTKSQKTAKIELLQRET